MYRCESDLYDPNGAEYETVEEFLEMCNECFGEEGVPALSEKMNGDVYEGETHILSKIHTVECECGRITGEKCLWKGNAEETVLVEYMPAYLRESHAHAGISGIGGGMSLHPHDGSQRLSVHWECAELLEDAWTRIVD